MTALQEAPDIADIIAGALQVSRGTAYDLMRTALAQQEADKPFQPDWVNYRQGVEDGKAEALLAQQGEQQPVAWYEYNQDLDAWFLAYGHNPKAKTRPLVFGDTAAPACQVDRLQMLVEQGKEAQELAKIMKDFADKNPKSLMLKELDK